MIQSIGSGFNGGVNCSSGKELGMHIEAAEFPLVRMSLDRQDIDGQIDSFSVFEELLSRAQSFVIIGVRDGHEAARETPEQRKQVTLWMKRNRQALHLWVRAMVYVEPHPAKRFAAKASAMAFSKFWGYPMIVAASDDDAHVIAARVLADEEPVSQTADQPDHDLPKRAL